MSHLVQKRIPTVPMPKEFTSETSHFTQTSQKTNRPNFLEAIYIPRETILPTLVVENPYIKVQHNPVVTVTQPVFLPVTIASREIGFVPYGVVQVRNPVYCVVSQGSTMTLLPKIVPNLVRF